MGTPITRCVRWKRHQRARIRDHVAFPGLTRREVHERERCGPYPKAGGGNRGDEKRVPGLDARLPLRIRGGGTKDFYGESLQGELLVRLVMAEVGVSSAPLAAELAACAIK